MSQSSIAELKAKYTDQYVEANALAPELARFRGKVGRVVTVNENGHALVDFQDGPWYDLSLEQLTVVDKPAPPPAPAAHEKKAPVEKKVPPKAPKPAAPEEG